MDKDEQYTETNPSKAVSNQAPSSPKNNPYKVNADVLKFLKKTNSAKKLKRKSLDQASGKKIICVKVKKTEVSTAFQDEVNGDIQKRHSERDQCTINQDGCKRLKIEAQINDNSDLRVVGQNRSNLQGQMSHNLSLKPESSLQSPHPILSKVSQIKGSVHEIIEEVNSALKGQGRVSFVAVKGSGQVSRVTEKSLIPVPQDSTLLEENSNDSDEEGMIGSSPTSSIKKPSSVHAGNLIREASYGDHHPQNRQQSERRNTGPECMVVKVEGHPHTGNQDSCSSQTLISRMPYKCRRCKSKPFCTRIELELHVSCHVTQGPDLLVFRCPGANCSVERRCYPRMVEHLILQHPAYEKMLRGTQTYNSVAGTFQCELCAAEFTLKVNLQKHVKIIHGLEKTLFSRKCDRCDVRFSKMSLAAFRLHRERCCYKYRCPQCDYCTTKMKNVELHMKVHTGEGLKCEVCGKLFANKARLTAHSKIHRGDRPKFVCDICQGEFAHHDALKKHRRRIHEHVEKLKCSQCQYETKMQADLNKHELFVHRKVFHCTFDGCEFQTNNQKFWNEHLDYHKPENIYSCPFEDCYYKAEMEEKVVQHLNGFHKINAKHQCPMCSKFFFKKTQLMRHIVTHTGQKMYNCQECQASFMSHSSYYKHRQKTGHDAGREGIVSVPQNIQIIQYQQTPGTSHNGGVNATHLGNGAEHNPVIVYRDDGQLVLSSESAGGFEGAMKGIHVGDGRSMHADETAVDPDTKVIYMDDCDDETKALILRELQMEYHVTGDNVVDRTVNYVEDIAQQSVKCVNSQHVAELTFNEADGEIVSQGAMNYMDSEMVTHGTVQYADSGNVSKGAVNHVDSEKISEATMNYVDSENVTQATVNYVDSDNITQGTVNYVDNENVTQGTMNYMNSEIAPRRIVQYVESANAAQGSVNYVDSDNITQGTVNFVDSDIVPQRTVQYVDSTNAPQGSVNYVDSENIIPGTVDFVDSESVTEGTVTYITQEGNRLVNVTSAGPVFLSDSQGAVFYSAAEQAMPYSGLTTVDAREIQHVEPISK